MANTSSSQKIYRKLTSQALQTSSPHKLCTQALHTSSANKLTTQALHTSSPHKLTTQALHTSSLHKLTTQALHAIFSTQGRGPSWQCKDCGCAIKYGDARRTAPYTLHPTPYTLNATTLISPKQCDARRTAPQRTRRRPPRDRYPPPLPLAPATAI